MTTNRELLADNGYEEVVVFCNPTYDGCLIGISSDNRAIYSFSDMVQFLMDTENMEEIEAIEFIEYNTIRACPYVENSPIVMYDLFDME